MFDEKQAELAKLNRDLRFKPANPDKARTLTAEQVGFIIPTAISSLSGSLTNRRRVRTERILIS